MIKTKVLFLSFLVLVLSSCGQKNMDDFTGTTAYNADFWQPYQLVLNEVLEVNNFEYRSVKFVHNSVNYEKLRSSQKLKNLVEKQYQALSTVKIPKSREGRLAFFMNSYNFLTLKDLQDHPQIESMKRLGWKSNRFVVSGQNLSLDGIEHSLIRPLKDPRIHFAINCASVGCPSLAKTVFTEKGLFKTLDELVENSLKNPLHLKKKGTVILTTKLLSWFKNDFLIHSEDGLNEFIAKHSSLSGDLNIKTELPYDWQLNNKENILKVLKESAKPYEIKLLK